MLSVTSHIFSICSDGNRERDRRYCDEVTTTSRGSCIDMTQYQSSAELGKFVLFILYWCRSIQAKDTHKCIVISVSLFVGSLISVYIDFYTFLLSMYIFTYIQSSILMKVRAHLHPHPHTHTHVCGWADDFSLPVAPSVISDCSSSRRVLHSVPCNGNLKGNKGMYQYLRYQHIILGHYILFFTAIILFSKC